MPASFGEEHETSRLFLLEHKAGPGSPNKSCSVLPAAFALKGVKALETAASLAEQPQDLYHVICVSEQPRVAAAGGEAGLSPAQIQSLLQEGERCFSDRWAH